MKQLLFFIVLSVLGCKMGNAQSLYKMPVKPISTKIINKEILYNEVLTQPQYDYHVVTIYTNYCGGTPFFFQRLKRFDSAGYKRVHWVCCSSADLNDSLETVQVLKKYGVYVDTVYLIDNKEYKEKRSDDRYKGFVFRKHICLPCKKDIIGVPYSIVFDNKKKIVAYGYIQDEEIRAAISKPIKP